MIQMKEKLVLETDYQCPKEIVGNLNNLGSTSGFPKVFKEEKNQRYILKVKLDDTLLPLNNIKTSISYIRAFSTYDNISKESERSEVDFENFGSDVTLMLS